MRAYDMHLAAHILPEKRQVLLTGSIDTNDFNISVKLELPEKGVWTIIKAETNLTNEPWTSWVMRLGENTGMPSKVEDRYLSSRQFKNAQYFPNYNSIVFGNGEIRPGEPVLKIYNVEIITKLYVVSHSGRRSGGVLFTSLEDILVSDIERKIQAQEDVIIPANVSYGNIDLVNEFQM